MPEEHTIYLHLGSNQGNREDNIRNATSLCEKSIGKISAASAVYETQPWGILDQPEFLNSALKLSTQLSPWSALKITKEIEVSIGRTKTEKWGPRIIDIDILFYDNIVVRSPELILPHPQMKNRNFVLVPVAEIAPDLVHPVLGKCMAELLATSPDTQKVAEYYTL